MEMEETVIWYRMKIIEITSKGEEDNLYTYLKQKGPSKRKDFSMCSKYNCLLIIQILISV